MRRNAILACIMLACVATTAFGQNPPRRPPGGGFGFGFGRGGDVGLQILNMEAVQKELALDQDQLGKIRELVAGAAQGLGGINFRDLQNLSPEERQKKIQELQEKATEKAKNIASEIDKLLNDKQRARLEQLKLQREGIAAISRKEVADKLGLSEEQRNKLAKLQEEARAAMRPSGNFQELSQEERRELFTKMQKAREKLNTDMENVLTAEQKETWGKMLGEKFEFPQSLGFPGAGPGGERRRPGGAGGAPGTAGGERRRPAGNTDPKPEDK